MKFQNYLIVLIKINKWLNLTQVKNQDHNKIFEVINLVLLLFYVIK